MKRMWKIQVLVLVLHVLLRTSSAMSRNIGTVRSDVIVTKYGSDDADDSKETEEEPGWMRRTLMKFGRVASRVGNAMGAHATKVTDFIDKFCEIIKTMIPLLAAICHVGQFRFCAATNDAPEGFREALAPQHLDLNAPD